MQFDNHDSRIRYEGVMLDGTLDSIPEYPLPGGYRFVFYKDGDRDSWINIEITAKELKDHAQGVEVWNKYYGGHEEELKSRMVFVENKAGEKVATATAYYDPFGNDSPDMGYLHWVAVRRDHQGRGLSKPLISFTLKRLRELGYEKVTIDTQTTTWLACKIYLDFGYRPTARSAVADRHGWEIVRALTHHPALENFREAAMEEVLDTEGD